MFATSVSRSIIRERWLKFSARRAMGRGAAPHASAGSAGPADGPYRILALDGGGIRALLTLTMLQRLEEAVPGLLRDCQLISGTSAGGIVALALASGLTPAQLVELILQRAGDLFQFARPRALPLPRGMFAAVYQNQALRQAAKEIFGDQRLCDLPRQVVIPSFSLDGGQSGDGRRCWSPIYYHNLDGGQVSRVSVADAALYTSAAPCLFPTADGHVDGGLTAANPSLVALTLTQDGRIQVRSRPALRNVLLLSLGTGHFYRRLDVTNANWGFLQWRPLLQDMILQGNIRQVDDQCRHLLGQRYFRLDPGLPRKIQPDALPLRHELIEIARQVDIGPAVDWLHRFFLPAGGR
jgi:uncharacterized protein